MWIVCAVFLSFVSAYAQVNRTVMTRGDEMMITFQRATRSYMQSITGAPYSADLIAEHEQTLADGTTIKDPPGSQHNVRDGQGRLRIEIPLVLPSSDQDGWQPRLTQISDPVAGFYYVFDDQNKIVHRLKLNLPPKPLPPRKFSVSESSVTPAGPDRPESRTENLGEKVIQGVMAKGVRYTRSLHSGTQNNDHPMTITQETWFSEDLQEVVYQKLTNPRSGQIVQRLDKIDRSEPNPALFQPPPDYKVVDEDDLFTITLRRPRP